MNRKELREMIIEELNEGYTLQVLSTIEDLPADIMRLDLKHMDDEDRIKIVANIKAIIRVLKKKGLTITF